MNSSYSKLNGADTRALTSKLRAHGIRVLGSTIVGLEHHTPGNIAGEIEQAVAHDTDFHQFMLFTPLPGTPLYQRMESEGRPLSEMVGAVCDCALVVVNPSPTQAVTKEWRLIFILVFSLPSLPTVRGDGGG